MLCLLWAGAQCAPGPRTAELGSAPSVPPRGLGKRGSRRWGPGSGNAQHLGVWGDLGAAPPGSVSTLPGAVSWVQRGQACAGVQGFIPSFLGAPHLWQPTLPLPMNSHSLSRIQRVQGWLEKGAVPPQCPGAEPAGPCSALPEPTFGLWGGSITPGLVWSLQGPAVTTGLTRSWNPAGVARAGDVRKWGLRWSMRAGWGTKSPRGEVLGQQLCRGPGPVQPGSVTTCPSATCQVWCQDCSGVTVLPFALPGAIAGVLQAFISQTGTPLFPSRGRHWTCPIPRVFPRGASPVPRGCFQPQVPGTSSPAQGGVRPMGVTLPWGHFGSGRCGPGAFPAAGSCWEVLGHQGCDVPPRACPL